MLNISETKQFRGSLPIGTRQESAYGALIGDIIDDITWLYDVIIFKVVAFGNYKAQTNYPWGPTAIEHCVKKSADSA